MSRDDSIPLAAHQIACPRRPAPGRDGSQVLSTAFYQAPSDICGGALFAVAVGSDGSVSVFSTTKPDQNYSVDGRALPRLTGHAPVIGEDSNGLVQSQMQPHGLHTTVAVQYVSPLSLDSAKSRMASYASESTVAALADPRLTKVGGTACRLDQALVHLCLNSIPFITLTHPHVWTASSLPVVWPEWSRQT